MCSSCCSFVQHLHHGRVTCLRLRMKPLLSLLFVCLLSMIYTDSGAHEEDSDGEGVAQDGGHSRANRLTETCALGLYVRSPCCKQGRAIRKPVSASPRV